MKTTNFAIDHNVAVMVLIFVLLVGGLGAYIGMPREAAPDITIPVVLVSTPYFGVSPSDIETLVTRPIEKELEDLKNVDEIRSTSAEGVSIVTVTFDPNVDLDEAIQKMREKVDKAKPELPEDAEDPVLTEKARTQRDRTDLRVCHLFREVGNPGLDPVLHCNVV